MATDWHLDVCSPGLVPVGPASLASGLTSMQRALGDPGRGHTTRLAAVPEGRAGRAISIAKPKPEQCHREPRAGGPLPRPHCTPLARWPWELTPLLCLPPRPAPPSPLLRLSAMQMDAMGIACLRRLHLPHQRPPVSGHLCGGLAARLPFPGWGPGWALEIQDPPLQSPWSFFRMAGVYQVLLPRIPALRGCAVWPRASAEASAETMPATSAANSATRAICPL